MGRRTRSALLNNRLRSKRQARGLSQQALGERCGLTRQAISAIEAGQYIPNTLVALRLAQVLDCGVEDLFVLSEACPHVEAECLDHLPDDGARPMRLQLARVGTRLLGYPLSGVRAAFTAADGLALASELLPCPPHPAPRKMTVALCAAPESIDHTLVVPGCDPALALLGAHLTRRYPAFRLLGLPRSSLAALHMLGRGEAHAAGMHLWDPESGDCNVPYVRRELPQQRCVVVTLSRWQQGLMVARGNPKGITGPADLARPDVQLVNRDVGSGSRLWLDLWLHEAGIRAEHVRGYAREVPTHLAVASMIANHGADVGPGVRSVAQMLGLAFIALQEERYDLVIPLAFLNTAPMQALLEVVVSSPFRDEMHALGGYDHSQTGTVVGELMPCS